MCTVCVCLLTCGDNNQGSETRGARFQGHLKGSGIMQYPVGVVFFLKRFKIDVYITDKYFVCFHNVHVHEWIYECVQNKII